MTDWPKWVLCRTTLTFLALRNFLPEQTLNADESMIPYFGQHGAKQYIHDKPIKFEYKTVNFTWLCHQFLPMSWSWKHRQRARSWGSVVHSLPNDLPMQQGSSYCINLFTSPQMLYLLPDNGMAATGALHQNRTEGAPLKSLETLKKEPCGSYVLCWARKLECAWFLGMTAK